MNLEQLIASFRVDADDLEEPHLFKDEWIAAWLSEAQAEAAIRGRLILEDANPAVCQIAVTAGQASYELHRSIYEIADLRFVRPDSEFTGRIQRIMSNSFAFAGSNASLIFESKHA